MVAVSNEMIMQKAAQHVTEIKWLKAIVDSKRFIYMWSKDDKKS
jgi:hypothetical protein